MQLDRSVLDRIVGEYGSQTSLTKWINEGGFLWQMDAKYLELKL